MLSPTIRLLTDLSEFVLLFLPLDGISLTMNHSVRSNNTVRRWVGLYNLELNCPHSSTHKEQISLTYWSVSFQEMWLEVCVEQVTVDTPVLTRI